MPRMSLEAIEDMTFGLLAAAGAADKVAKCVARSIRRAEADDIRSVGLGYLPTYLAHLRSGRVNGQAVPIVTRPRTGVVAVDAADGFAHPAIEAGLGALVDAARRSGVATMSVRRSYSPGVLGHVVEDVALKGLVAIAAANSPPNMTAWKGRRRIFGTNPIAFAAPCRGMAPLVIDQATTVVTKVALVQAAHAGGPIPSDWAFDAEGAATTDPQAALAGSMAPAGGVKGVNIAMMVEILAAVITGAELSMDVVPYAKPDGPPAGVGQMIIAIDPDAHAAGFADRLARLANGTLADDARMPGDRRLVARDHNARHGVEVDTALLLRLRT